MQLYGSFRFGQCSPKEIEQSIQDFVLSEFSLEQLDTIPKLLSNLSIGIELWIQERVDMAVQYCNSYKLKNSNIF